MIVYIYTFPNGKKYIGQTIQTLNQRAQSGYGYKNQLVGKAIQKYGWNNIQKEIFECKSEKEMDELEKQLINKYKTLDRNYGYNLEEGGHEGKHLSEETKEKIKLSNSGEKNYWYGKHHSEEAKRKMSESHLGKHHTEETKKKMSESHKGKCLSEETKKKISISHLGKKHSDETKKKCGEANIGRIPPNAKKVICIETKKIYDSTGIAAKEYNLKSYTSIINACKGYSKSAGGHHWMWLEDYEKMNLQ